MNDFGLQPQQEAPAFTRYAVFACADLGGKQVAVWPNATGDLQARATAAGLPLSVFIESMSAGELRLRVFTPRKEKGESDSASVAALSFAQQALAQQGVLLDIVDLQTANRTGSKSSSVTAQLCGGNWLLQQGVVQVQDAPQMVSFAQARAAHVAATSRPNLVLEVPNLVALDAFVPDATQISLLNEQTQTTGLVLYTTQAAETGPQRRADVSFRAFGPLKGFLEDAASSNMLACLTGVLAQRGLLPSEGNLLRAAQRMPEQPALLTAQYGRPDEAIWVGGQANSI